MKTAPAPQPLPDYVIQAGIFIRKPCSENYDEMTSVHGGKFCDSCKHVVHDFTAMSNQQIIGVIESHNGKVCGMFDNEQLAPSRKRWSTVLKVSVFAAVALWFSKSDLKAQKQTDVVQNTNTISDSVVLLVRGEIKSEGKTVYRSTVEARDSSGNVIATAKSYSGKFELHVPVAYPKQPFTIVVTSKGYRDEVITDYVSAAGNVIAIEMNRRLFGKPSRPFRSIGCPSF